MPETKPCIRTKMEINTPMYGYITNHFTFDAMLRILRDDVVAVDDYIEFITEEGFRAAVRKKDIISIEVVE